jgi:hypothetical protein
VRTSLNHRQLVVLVFVDEQVDVVLEYAIDESQ